MSTRTYRKSRIEDKARQDETLLAFARRIGHHGAANFIEAVRQREHMAITPEYAADLLKRAGY